MAADGSNGVPPRDRGLALATPKPVKRSVIKICYGVMNTVGSRANSAIVDPLRRLVSMLTEGWDTKPRSRTSGVRGFRHASLFANRSWPLPPPLIDDFNEEQLLNIE